ncbi:PiggyBac transposable element-derived protein 3 [Trichinella sp. T8]|nr:PiggyBac transposable element-derived protein 3 [Trichinella sp. T8]
MASRFLTLENAIDYLETLPPEDQINAEVCQLPPCEDGNLTDEEHIEEDDFDEVMPLDVCGEVDVTLDSDRIVNEDDVFLPLSTVAPELISLAPIELFYKIIPKEEMSHFAEMTKRYALQKGVTLSVEEEDIEQFFGLLSGYHSVPSEFMFWSTTTELIKYFHVVDNMRFQEGDKLAKISPMYENMGKRLRQWGILDEALSIDVCMVPYHGHHSCITFIKGKPIRFGFKVWMMTSSSGYPYAMQIYAGVAKVVDIDPLGSMGLSKGSIKA